MYIRVLIIFFAFLWGSQKCGSIALPNREGKMNTDTYMYEPEKSPSLQPHLKAPFPKATVNLSWSCFCKHKVHYAYFLLFTYARLLNNIHIKYL